MSDKILKMIEESANKLGCGKGELLHELCGIFEELLQENLYYNK